MKIGIVCYPTYGGSGVVATELGKALAREGHHVHFITYMRPPRLDVFQPNVFLMCNYRYENSKGQLISKGNFSAFNSLNKQS